MIYNFFVVSIVTQYFHTRHPSLQIVINQTRLFHCEFQFLYKIHTEILFLVIFGCRNNITPLAAKGPNLLQK